MRGSTESTLRQLARHLAETIERDSRALVQEVCVHILGAQRTGSDQEEAPARQLSSSCSDEVRAHRGHPPPGLQLLHGCGARGSTFCWAVQGRIQLAC